MTTGRPKGEQATEEKGGLQLRGLDGRTDTNDGSLIGKAPETKEKDMEKRPKKAVLAAISAAVTTYIKTQEEALAAAIMPAAASAPTPAASSFYAAYGRQQMMEMRRLLSFRMGRR